MTIVGMVQQLSAEAEALWREAEHAVDTHRSEERVLQLLVKLARVAPVASDAWLYALRQLSERAVADDPWRASMLARRIVQQRPDSDGGWAVLGLAQSLLGHHRYAVRAYRKALRLAPRNPWYAHNLGHLYDFALGRPREALPLLRRALDELRSWSAMSHIDLTRAIDEVAASYAHALLQSGDASTAKTVMRQVVSRTSTPGHHELYSEILRVHEALLAAEPPPPSKRRRVKRSKRSS
jgi:tetratricopeptide (TPR) repeat protein